MSGHQLARINYSAIAAALPEEDFIPFERLTEDEKAAYLAGAKAVLDTVRLESNHPE